MPVTSHCDLCCVPSGNYSIPLFSFVVLFASTHLFSPFFLPFLPNRGNFGLWLDGDLYHGSSHPCKTFGNQTLSSEEDFVVKSIESWGFV